LLLGDARQNITLNAGITGVMRLEETLTGEALCMTGKNTD
jgi:hypothetical protein